MREYFEGDFFGLFEGIIPYVSYELDKIGSRGSSVSIVTRLQAGRSGFDSRQGRVFSLRHRIQTDSGAHPASYSIGTGASFFRVKRPKREADHSPTLPHASSQRGA
jgi:hypothetical protein